MPAGYPTGPSGSRRSRSECVHELMAVAKLLARLGVILAARDAARWVQPLVGAERDRRCLLRLLRQVRGPLRHQNHQIVADARVVRDGRGGGPWLGSHGAGVIRRHPEADGADVLADVARALAVRAGAVVL